LLRIKKVLEVGRRFKELLVVGDQQTWKYMVELKEEYVDDFNWLLSMPGDWRTLLNTQPMIKKIFLDAGLLNLATNFGYTEVSAKANLADSKNFRRNHWFIIECWEAMLQAMILDFLKEKGYDIDGSSLEDVVRAFDNQQPFKGTQREAEVKKAQLLGQVDETLARAGLDKEGLREEFHTWAERRAEGSKMWAFWWRFVHEDGWGYVALWLSIRSTNWDLRVAAYKRLAALFRAWDKTHYQREVPLHLAHLEQWPWYIVDALKADLWTVSIRGSPYKSIALDEAHEQLINRELKMSLSRPSGPENLLFRTNTLNL
jgi:hypothetical protein